MSIKLWDGFQRGRAPETGRTIIQLTRGDATCYPLYYFIPTFTEEGSRLVYHRAGKEGVQIHVLNIETGESARLTRAQSARGQWIPWCVDSGGGVLDHRSVLDTRRERLIYFDGNQARSVDLNAGTDRHLFTLPRDRVAIGQNCMSPDGEWLVYIHHDQELFERIYPHARQGDRSLSRGTVLAAHHMESGEQRTLVTINSPIHHVLPYGDDSLIFCHPATENGMLQTDLRGGWYTHLRTQDDAHGCVCHYVATRRGLAYEVLGRDDGRVLSGLYDPASHRRYEFVLPSDFGYTHTGRDPEGALWFYENCHPAPWIEPDESKQVHDIRFLVRHRPEGADEWQRLLGHWPTYGGGQKSHFHPQVSPDRRWLLITAGDPESGTNHLFLVDIADLKPTRGIPEVR